MEQKTNYKQMKTQKHKNLLNKKVREALENWFNTTFIKLCDADKINRICIETLNKRIKNIADFENDDISNALKHLYYQQSEINLWIDEFINTTTEDEKVELFKHRKGIEYDSIKKNCKSKFIEYRNKANQDFAHGRIPEIIASEYMGIELFLEFANNKQAIPHEKMRHLKIESWNDLIKAAQKQNMRTEENRTDNMFFRAVQELLESKKIYLKSYKNHQREPDMSLATFVGYYDEEKQRCYLLPNVIFNEVVKFYGIQGTKFPGNALSTWKYLKEAGRLFPGEKDRNKTRKSINGKLVTFIEVMAVDVFGTEERAFGDYLNKFPINPENHSKNISVDEIELPF